jgi:CBS domain-containing protein
VVEADRSLVGVITRKELHELIGKSKTGEHPADFELAGIVTKKLQPVVAYPDEPLRAVVYRMAESGLTRFPVVERRVDRTHGSKQQRGTGSAVPRVVGLVSLNDLLKARVMNLEAERKRERVLPIRMFPLGAHKRAADLGARK